MAEPVETPRRNLTGAVVPAVAAAALAAVGTMLLVGRSGGEKTAELPVIENCILEGADAVNGPIELVDSNGSTITQADFAGEFSRSRAGENAILFAHQGLCQKNRIFDAFDIHATRKSAARAVHQR